MTAYRKKLIEVALPLEEINVASAREKSIRHGHPSTLHTCGGDGRWQPAARSSSPQLVDDPGEEGVCRKTCWTISILCYRSEQSTGIWWKRRFLTTRASSSRSKRSGASKPQGSEGTGYLHLSS